MNRSSKIVVAAVTLGVLAGIGWGGSVYASQEDQKAATKAMQDYVTAYKIYDIAEMSKFVKDTRYADEKSLQEANERHIASDKKAHSKLKLVSVEQGPDGFAATFEQTSDEQEAVQFTLPLVEDEDGWKLLIDGSLTIDTKKK